MDLDSLLTEITKKVEIMNIDLEKMDLAELKLLQKQVEKAIVGFEARQRKTAIEAAEKVASQHVFSLAKLTGQMIKKPGSIAVAKYEHPENPLLTWTGKGRRPAWFIEAIEAGTDPEDLEV